jgi:hypothetical protein
MVVADLSDSFAFASVDEAIKPMAASDNTNDNNFFTVFPFPDVWPGDSRRASFYV